MARTRTSTPDIGIPARPTYFFAYERAYGLWARVTQNGNVQRREYFLDNLATLPAGEATETRTETNGTVATQGQISLKGGEKVGLAGTWTSFVTPSGGNGTSDLWFPVEGRCRVDVTTAGDAWSVRARQDARDGTWREHSASRAGTGQISGNCTTSSGMQIQLLFSPNGSGDGSISGAGTGLPASLKWGSNGEATITWANGAKSAARVG
jgi:hypothetical protein